MGALGHAPPFGLELEKLGKGTSLCLKRFQKMGPFLALFRSLPPPLWGMTPLFEILNTPLGVGRGAVLGCTSTLLVGKFGTLVNAI